MIEPTEEMLEAARVAGAADAAQEFWAEVSERLDEYEPEITPRPVKQ